jgi:hypothetical protein
MHRNRSQSGTRGPTPTEAANLAANLLYQAHAALVGLDVRGKQLLAEQLGPNAGFAGPSLASCSSSLRKLCRFVLFEYLR